MFSTSLVRSFLLSLIFLAPFVAVAKHHHEGLSKAEMLEKIIHLEKKLHDYECHDDIFDQIKRHKKCIGYTTVIGLAALAIGYLAAK